MYIRGFQPAFESRRLLLLLLRGGGGLLVAAVAHGVPAAVEEDVGDAVVASPGGMRGGGGPDGLLRDRLDDDVIAVQPRGQAGVVHVSHVVALGGLRPVVVHHSEELGKVFV